MAENANNGATPKDAGKGETNGLPDLESVLAQARADDIAAKQPDQVLTLSQTLAPQTAANATPVSGSNGTQQPKIDKPTRMFERWLRTVIIAMAVLVLVGLAAFGVWALKHKASSSQHQATLATQYKATADPLKELAAKAASTLSVGNDNSAQLTVNGTLSVNGNFVIEGTGVPAHPVAGQLYYDQAAGKLYFYNGTDFIDVTFASSLNQTLNQALSQVAASGVTSIQGLKGDLNFTPGGGIAINGTTISNTGVVSLVAGSPNLNLVSDGNGGYTITDTNAASSVQLQSGTPGTPQTGNINISGTMVAAQFQGDGSGVTNLDAGNVATGTLDDSRLSTNVTLQGNAFNGVNQLVQTNGVGELPAISGANLTNLNASSLTSGTVDDARLSTNVTLKGNTFNGANQLVQLNSSGDLPVLSALNLTNLNVSNATAGTLNDARLSLNVTVQGNTFNGANQLLQLTNLGYLPVVNGSNLTALNATQLASGTVADGRLSANVALLNGNQTFSGNNTFSQAINANTITPSSALTVGATGQSFTLQGNGASTITATQSGKTTTVGFTGTPVANVQYLFDTTVGAGAYTICTTVGNCLGGGGSGVSTPGGTTNKLAKFTSGTTIANSAISDNGATTTIQYGTDSTNAFQVQNAAGTSNLLVANTTSNRIGIATATPGYTLDVNGDINSATALRVGGVAVCDSSGCIASSNSGLYIQNGTGTQATANFNIQSASASAVGGVIKGASGQTADLFELQQGATTVAKVTPAGDIDITGLYKINGAQIASNNLSDGSNLAKLNATQIFTGNQTFKNTSDSTNAFQIQNAAGTSNLLVADTTDSRLGVGTATPGYTLDVNGDVNIAMGQSFRIGGVALCGPTANCAPASGSAYYVQNSTAQQTATNFNIQSANATAIGGIIQGASGQTADLLRLRDGNGANVVAFGNEGQLTLGQNTVSNGTIVFNSQSGSGSISLTAQNPGTSTIALTLPAITGTLCVQGSNNCGFAATSGSTAYVQNGTTTQAATNFNIQSANATSIGGLVQGADNATQPVFVAKGGATPGAGGDLLQLQNSGGIALSKFDANGQFTLGNLTTASQAGSLTFADGTNDGFGATINTSTLTANRTFTLENTGGIICTTAASPACTGTYGSAQGSGNYIQNNVGLPQSANFNIVSGATSSPAGTLIGATSATTPVLLVKGGATPGAGGDLLQLQNSSGTPLVSVSATGNLAAVAYNGQTISSAASFTGTLATAGALTVSSGGANVFGGITNNSGGISNTGALAGVTTINANNTLTITGGGASIIGGLNNNTSGITNAGAVSGVTTLSTSGAINGQTISSNANFTGTLAVQGGSALTLGTANANTGAILFKDATSSGTLTLNVASLGGAQTITLPNASGTVCVSSNNCSYAAATLGSGYIQNGTSQQAGSNFNISGTGIAGVALQAPSYDTATATVLNLGTTNATSISVAKAGVTTTVNGALTSVGAATMQAGATIQTGAAGTVGVTIQGASGQTANLLQLQNATGVLARFNNNADLLIGGTSASTSSTTAFQVQNTSGVNVLSVDTANSLLTLQGVNSNGTKGSELTVSQDFTNATYWTCSSGWVPNTTSSTHTAGNTTTCAATAANMSITAGSTYLVSATYSGTMVAGESVAVQVGGTNGPSYNSTGGGQSVVITATNTTPLVFTPTSGFAGRVSAVSVTLLTASNAVLQAKSSSATTGLEVRVPTVGSDTFIGLNSGRYNITGTSNTALGANALANNTTGNSNVAVGANSLASNTSGSLNVALGRNTLTNNTTGSSNTAIGDSILSNNTVGGGNLAVGSTILTSNTSGNSNIGIGSSLLTSNTTGVTNIAIGFSSLVLNTTGANNIGIGSNALRNNSTGSNNLGLGNNAGYRDTGTNFVTSAGLQNATAIGANTQVQASNSIVLGSIDTPTNVGIGTTIPLNTFSVSPVDYATGTASQSGTTTVTGSGTSWTSAMVGEQFIFADGQTGTITNVANSTTLTLSTSLTYSGAYRIHHIGFQVTSAGNAYIQNTSTTAFQVQNNSGVSLLTVDSSANTITLGNASLSSVRLNLASDNAIQSTVTIGSTNASSTTLIQGGNGNGGTPVSIQAAGGGTIAIGTVNINTVSIGAVGNSTNIDTVNISNTAGNAQQVVGIGSSGSSSSTLTLEAGTGATALQIGNGATAHGIQIGTGAAVQTVVVGSTNTSSALTLQAGTGGLNVGTGGVANTVQIGNTTGAVSQTVALGTNATSGSTNLVSVGSGTSASTLTLEAGTGASALQIGNGATAHGIKIGTGAAVQTVAIGSTNTSSALTLQAGTGGLNLGTGGVANTMQIGNTTGAVSQTIALGTNATSGASNVVNIGGATSGSTLTLEAGTTSNAIQIGNGATAHGIQVGTGAAVQTVAIGSSNSSSSLSLQAGTGGLNIGTGGAANTVQIGNTTGAVTQVVNVGNNATASSITNVTVGSTVGTSTTTIQAGSGGISVGSATATLTVNGALTATSGITTLSTLNVTTALKTGNTTRIDSSGNLTNIGTISSVGNATINGHIITGNASGTTTVAAGAAANCTLTSPTVGITGNDTSGTVTITTATGVCSAGTLATITFANAYGTAPAVILTPKDANGASLQYYYGSGTTTFDIKTGTAPNTNNTTYTYSYHVEQ